MAIKDIERAFIVTFRRRGRKFDNRFKNNFRFEISLKAMLTFDTYESRASKLLRIALKDSNEPFMVKKSFLDFRNGFMKIQRQMRNYQQSKF